MKGVYTLESRVITNGVSGWVYVLGVLGTLRLWIYGIYWFCNGYYRNGKKNLVTVYVA